MLEDAREAPFVADDENDATPHGVDEKRLVRKLDTYLIPLIMGLYLFSFLDRLLFYLLNFPKQKLTANINAGLTLATPASTILRPT